MTPRTRGAAIVLTGLAITLALSGFQIAKYPFKRRDFPQGQPHRTVYRDLTPEQIKPHMKKMAAELGVKCSYCHDEKDYASEAKPEKDFARSKMMMLDWLNHKYRPEETPWHYTCWQCHRGKVRPVPEGPEDLKKKP